MVLPQVSGQGLDVVSEHGVEAHPPYQLVRFGSSGNQLATMADMGQ